jgi:hypothetical protein
LSLAASLVLVSRWPAALESCLQFTVDVIVCPPLLSSFVWRRTLVGVTAAPSFVIGLLVRPIACDALSFFVTVLYLQIWAHLTDYLGAWTSCTWWH